MHKTAPHFSQELSPKLVCWVFWAVLALSGACLNQASAAVTDPETQLVDVGVIDRRSNRVDLNLQFQDETGRTVALGEAVVPGRPIIIVPAYYDCPRMCGLLLNGVVSLLNELSLRLNEEFSVVTVSFDPHDTVTKAQTYTEGFRKRLTGNFAAPGASGWKFLVGPAASSEALFDALGFKYKKDEEEYSHTAAIFILTPEGVLSQYFAGISFAANDVRYALVDASRGAIGSVLDQAFLFCFDYDHIAGKYVWAAFGIMRLGGIITLSLLSFLIYRLYRIEKQKRQGGRSETAGLDSAAR